MRKNIGRAVIFATDRIIPLMSMYFKEHINTTDLAKETGITRSAMSQMMAVLRDCGMIEPLPLDRLKIPYRLTAKGREVAEKFLTLYEVMDGKKWR